MDQLIKKNLYDFFKGFYRDCYRDSMGISRRILLRFKGIVKDFLKDARGISIRSLKWIL